MAQQPLGGSPAWVGEQFVSKYYDVLEKLPKYVHRFYKDNSTFMVTDVQPDGRANVESAAGSLDAIQDKVMATLANAVVAADKAIDAQFSDAKGVLLQVTGTLKLQGVDRKFAQTFFLATQEKGYYVLNDMMRIFAPEPARPLENGFVGGVHPTGFSAPVAQHPQISNQMLRAEPRAVPTPAAPVAAAALPAAAIPVPEPVSPTVAPAPQPPMPLPVPAVPAAVKAAPVAVPAAAPAPAQPPAVQPPPQNLSWAERFKLGQVNGSAPASTTGSKPATPAKAPPAPEPSSATAEPSSSDTPAIGGDALDDAFAAAASGPANGDAKSAAAADDDAMPKPPTSVEDDPTLGIYVQQLPQEMSMSDLKTLLEGEFVRFGPLKARGAINIVRSPRHGWVAYVFFEDKKGVEAALAESGKFKLGDADQNVIIKQILKEFAQGFNPRGAGGGRGGPGRSGMGMGYRGGRGGYDPSRGRGGRGEGGRGDGGRGDRPPSGPGSFTGRGRGMEGRGRGMEGRGRGMEGRGRGPPRDTSSSSGGAARHA